VRRAEERNMLENDTTNSDQTPESPSDAAADTPGAAPKKAAAKRAPAKKAAAKRTTTRKTVAKKVAAPAAAEPVGEEPPAVEAPAASEEPAKKTAAKRSTAKKATAKKAAARKKATAVPELAPDAPAAEIPAVVVPEESASAPALLFKAPEPTVTRRTRKAAKVPVQTTAPEVDEDEDEAPADEIPVPRKTTARKSQPRKRAASDQADTAEAPAPAAADDDQDDSIDGDDDGEGGGGRRRRRRGGRRRRKPGDGESGDSGNDQDSRQDNRQDSRQDVKQDGKQDNRGGGPDTDDSDDGEGTSRRRRRRRRTGDDGPEGSDDPENTVTRVRRQRNAEDEITAISGSTRLEAKKQRRRDGREAGRRRAPIVSEAEFLARREAVERVMVIRQREDLTQIAVLEDKVLVEHYVARESQTSIIGNVYLGRVQNVLPSMEAAFIDIGKGRNAVLYAGEVNWSSLGHRDGQPRKIESVLSSGQSILVQVTKDPIGHKGARLTSQVSLAGRFLVYVPDGTTSGISRKLPDTERNRLKTLLKEIVPDTAGVIVRTAAEGASEDELTRDVERLKARWEDIEAKVKGSAPQLLYGEPDLTLKVVRDLFTEDFTRLVIEGEDAWDTVQGYVQHVAPDLEQRLERYDAAPHNGKDSFAAHRVEEQIAKGLDRKVWLPSGGSLVIDRTEAMTVVDVNTGKFTGSGGNLEETVTKNNLEAAEEMVRQLRLRDIGGIIVIDFIDMVLESNRDLVLRRLVECLGRDRTRHQVAEVTSLGLVQMTRKRIGTGLVEAFSENCAHCQGRGVVIQDTPVDPAKAEEEESRRGGRRSRGGRGRQDGDQDQGQQDHDHGRGSNGHGNGKAAVPSPTYVAAVAKPENAQQSVADEPDAAGTPDASGTRADESTDAVPPSDEGTSTRSSRGSRSRRRGAPADAPAESPVDAPAETPVDAPAETPALSPVAEPVLAEEPPAAPQQPRVVTRTRRSASRRTPTTTAPEAASPVEVPAEAPPEAPPVAAPEAVAAPVAAEPPRVVTRTRGRSATRPAGPPTAGSGATVSEAGSAEPDAGDDPLVDDHHVEHVPVKKKGSRKR
jgi:ribonuclease E